MDGELVLGQMPDDGEGEADERYGGEQDVERESTGEKGDVVFIGRLDGSPDDTGDRAVPAAFTVHASGSSSSSGAGVAGRAARRRRRASSNRRRSCSRVLISASSSSSSAAASAWASASSSASFNSPRTSSTFSSASSFRFRRPLDTLRRAVSPRSVGANMKPATAPSTMPNKNAPKPPPRPDRSFA